MEKNVRSLSAIYKSKQFVRLVSGAIIPSPSGQKEDEDQRKNKVQIQFFVVKI